jgi:hypothetical protein
MCLHISFKYSQLKNNLTFSFSTHTHTHTRTHTKTPLFHEFTTFYAAGGTYTHTQKTPLLKEFTTFSAAGWHLNKNPIVIKISDLYSL